MAKTIQNTPAPSILMNSMRSIGYSFKTALADIIDNSISAGAKNVYINVPINDDNLFISIIDDGSGMSDDDLFNAMKYGSDRKYSETDLGRFGLGLKSASLSQCRVLTVLSKMNSTVSGYKWDLDAVESSKKRDCIYLESDDYSQIPNFNKFNKIPEGTMVVWQNFDIAFRKSNGRVREYLSDEVDEAEKHLALVFHRFLSNRFKPFRIFINNDPVIPVDPFLEDHPKTDTKKSSDLTLNGEIIKVQPYILPHQSDLSAEDIEKIGGIESLRGGQGFYIYRNDRLIIHGTWFRLASANISSELLKYGRIKVDIPNALDDVWDIDIKKQNATIPKQILNNLKKAVSDVNSRSSEKSTKRAKLTLEKDNSKIWNKSLSKNGKEVYYINKDSEFVRSFLDEFEDSDRNKIINFIDVVSTAIPFDDIYTSICNKRNETAITDSQFDSIVVEGLAQFRRIKGIIQKSDEEVFRVLTKNEPYNNSQVSNRIWEIIQNEK